LSSTWIKDKISNLKKVIDKAYQKIILIEKESYNYNTWIIIIKKIKSYMKRAKENITDISMLT